MWKVMKKGYEDEQIKMRKAIRKREESFDEDKDIVKFWGK